MMRHSRLPVRSARAVTIPEVLVVLAILGVVAITGWLTLQWLDSRFKTANLENTLRQTEASMQQYHDARAMFPTTIQELRTVEPGPTFITGPADQDLHISVAFHPSGDAMGFAGYEHGHCVLIRVVPTANQPSATARHNNPNDTCSGSDALSITGTEW